MTHQEARKRLSCFVQQIKELKQSLCQIERSVQNLLKSAPLPLPGTGMLDACKQIDYEEFVALFTGINLVQAAADVSSSHEHAQD